jgi:membrane protease YdiL (CAAX protease family)
MPVELPVAEQPKITVRRQIIVCIGMSVLALILIHIQGRSIGTIIAAGQPLHLQTGFGLAVGAAAALAALIGYKWQASKAHTKSIVNSYNRLNLSGWNPVWISLAAGFGEELLFRGALQPLLGILFASLVFVIAHIPAYQVKSFTLTTLIQATGVFATSIFLGVVFEYVGLVAAMLVHALIDLVGLYTIRRGARGVAAVTG